MQGFAVRRFKRRAACSWEAKDRGPARQCEGLGSRVARLGRDAEPCDRVLA
jgi:hypothetical protein